MGRHRLDRSKTCPRCGVEFRPKDWRNTFCSRRCAQTRDLPTKTCPRCGVVFRKSNEYSYAVWETIRFCSPKCRGNGRPDRQTVACVTCGTTFVRLNRLHRFCSQDCAGVARRTAAFPDKRRGACFTNSMKAKLLAAAGHRCKACGATEDLECDHVVPIFQGGPNTLANGQVLCRPCHRAKTNAELRAAWAAAA